MDKNKVLIGTVVVGSFALGSIGAGVMLNNQVPAEDSQVLETQPITGDHVKETENEMEAVTADVLGYKMEMIDGSMQSLEDYRGKVVLIVNVASACGLTPQYEGLEALYRAKKKEGLVVLGFPANNFGAQEPGTNEEIAQFCSTKFDVSFPMFAKIDVKGKEAHPLYKQLAAQPEPIGGEPEWNFAKFVVDSNGEVVARFSARTTPEDKDLLTMIEELLEEVEH